MEGGRGYRRSASSLFLLRSFLNSAWLTFCKTEDPYLFLILSLFSFLYLLLYFILISFIFWKFLTLIFNQSVFMFRSKICTVIHAFYCFLLSNFAGVRRFLLLFTFLTSEILSIWPVSLRSRVLFSLSLISRVCKCVGGVGGWHNISLTTQFFLFEISNNKEICLFICCHNFVPTY